MQVTAASDFIAKVDVTNLKAGTSYVFAFSDGEAVSAVGQTKTAPGPEQEVESMVYAVFSCSHYANGWFHPYDIASTIKDLDFWVHTGDYVYEYGLYSTYASVSLPIQSTRVCFVNITHTLNASQCFSTQN